MEAATATASCGQVRSRRRARTLSRGGWRLVVLLGLSWVALLLLGGTAHAAPCEKQACVAAPGARPTTPDAQPLPLVGEILAHAGDTTAALPVQQVADIATTALGGLAGKAPDAAAASLPVASSIDAVGAVAETVRSTADSAGGEKLLDVKLPSATSTAAPLVAGLAGQAVSTAYAALESVEVLTVRLPVAGGLTDTLRATTDTLDLTMQAVVGATYALAGATDQAVGLTGSVLSPILETITSPAGTIGVTVPGAGAGATSAPSPAADCFGSSPVPGEAAATQVHSAQAGQSLGGRALSGPAVPPPDSNAFTTVAVQPAADIVTILPVPVSGAGFTSGNGGTTPAPRLDQTLVRVESGPTVEFKTTKPVEGHTGPMPGTPSADPAFSPD
jgi:hypothetical protein